MATQQNGQRVVLRGQKDQQQLTLHGFEALPNNLGSVCHFSYFNCFCSSLQKSASDYNNFDREFLSEKPRLSHSDKNLIDSMDQSAFAGFSFINPKFEQILEK